MLDVQATAELERDLKAALPEWIDQEPARWQQIQYALRRASYSGAVFASFDEFIDWLDEDTSAEWLNGEVIFMSPASTRHQLIVGFFHKLIGFYAEANRLGVVLNALFKMKLAQYGPEPDLIFVKEQHRDRLRENYLDGPADLVVEVVSPESIDRDRGQKYVAYEAAGIPEYWLIDPDREVAEFYQLDDHGRYQLQQIPDDERYHSLVLPGFWLRANWLWQSPLPATLDVLRQLEVL
jgi:Uma2 family endonuclease